MNITELDLDNIIEFGDILDEDILENIVREYYHGIVASDDDMSSPGAMVWEYKNHNDAKKKDLLNGVKLAAAEESNIKDIETMYIIRNEDETADDFTERFIKNFEIDK
jgi:hypothetical protein